MTTQRKFSQTYSQSADFWQPDEPGPIVRAPRNTLVLPDHEPKRTVTAYPVNDAQAALTTGLMQKADTLHTADPVSRGYGLLIKMIAPTLLLWFFTLAGLVLLEQLGFFLWLLLASLEGLACFFFLAYNDWREHPNAVRWQWTTGLLTMMQEEHGIRMYNQYGFSSLKELKRHERTRRRAAQLSSNR